MEKPKRPAIDITAVRDLESRANDIRDNLNEMLTKLKSNMDQISQVTVDGLKIYQHSVDDICDSLDRNIHSMYNLMSKCDEIDRNMNPLYEMAAEIYICVNESISKN
ncbi:uncharacterized protein TRIADDRAFT_55300 [Trichoplax adhaerens]|uniref:BLOC-1-related complex subunit 6 C-terminal helix domain-containing protein n=1 Tax=Trichoplax adhaerens TaxID=10228 RepID=B3RUI3_TRIAD|nr:hypothetical protein TRIADDRAFT_55300 [Trichoplax adhaerens]EDV25338.1 hypothetical protein TRIADDRAFT_55300 [Trichoplax adhaerens]|eukprot:XP_002111371.1 hypothetical protein TRIADDRAFT_55300 [Trichoplax adhaerens]